MWDTLERARRRLLGDAPRSEAVTDQPGRAEPTDLSDLSFALGRDELERLIAALDALPDSTPGRADTPARLEAALGRAIAHVAGFGQPSVTRQPAGLHTPEAWQIGIAHADDRTRLALESAIRGGGIA